MMMLLIVPIITYRHDSMSYAPILSENAYSTGVKVDVFNYYKAIVFNGLTLVALGVFIYKIVVLKDEVRNSKLNIVMIIMAAITPLTLKYTDITIFGNYDRYE